MKKLNSKVSKRIAAILLVATTAFTVMGCSVEKTVTKTETTTEITTETTEVADNNEVTEADDNTDSFGLKDYEGFYCRTETEEIEDYVVTYTYGYLFNGDGTGVSYGQDVVDLTWNETEIHFADSTVIFTMEPGKLTVDGIEYDKIDGNFIAPNPYDIDTDNIENGIFHAYIDESGIEEADGQLTIRAEIYSEDTYDIVDINRMTAGDVIYINGMLLPVESVDQNDFGLLEINGGIENGGSALIAVDESNCFVYAGMDMQSSFTRQGISTLAVSDDLKLFDHYDPTEEKEYTGSDAVDALKAIVKDYPLTCYDCSITVENGVIVEVRRLYIP